MEVPWLIASSTDDHELIDGIWIRKSISLYYISSKPTSRLGCGVEWHSFLVGKAIVGDGIYAVLARATLMIASLLYADSDAELLNLKSNVRSNFKRL